MSKLYIDRFYPNVWTVFSEQGYSNHLNITMFLHLSAYCKITRQRWTELNPEWKPYNDRNLDFEDKRIVLPVNVISCVSKKELEQLKDILLAY